MEEQKRTTKTADFYDLLIGQLGRCIDDLERCRRRGLADGGQTEKELLNHFGYYFWLLSLALNERAEKIKGDELKIEKKEMSLSGAGRNAIAAGEDLEPLWGRKIVTGVEMVNAVTELFYMKKLLPLVQGEILKEWPELAKILNEIEENCYEH